MILLLTAAAFEQEILVRQLSEAVRQQVAARTWHSGRLEEVPVRLVETGIGAVNAAHALTCVLQAERPDLVLQIGIGGAYPQSGLAAGDVAVASEEIYGDLGVRTPQGWQSAELIGMPLLERDGSFFNRFALECGRVDRVRGALEAHTWAPEAPRVRVGPFLTVQECSGTTALSRERAGRWGAICENMEGAAAAHLCRLYAVPFVEVRGISNRVEDRRRERWNLPLAAARAQEAACCLLRDPALGACSESF